MNSLKEKIVFTEQEIDDLRNLQKCLSPIKILVHHLSARYINVSKADYAVEHTINELKKFNTNFSFKLARHIEIRYKERRNSKFILCLNYIHNPKSFSNENQNFKDSMLKELMLDFNRMFATEFQNPSENICQNNVENNFKNEKNEFVPEEFSISLKEAMLGPHESIFEKENNIDNEFKSYLNGGRWEYIYLLFLC